MSKSNEGDEAPTCLVDSKAWSRTDGCLSADTLSEVDKANNCNSGGCRIDCVTNDSCLSLDQESAGTGYSRSLDMAADSEEKLDYGECQVCAQRGSPKRDRAGHTEPHLEPELKQRMVKKCDHELMPPTPQLRRSPHKGLCISIAQNMLQKLLHFLWRRYVDLKASVDPFHQQILKTAFLLLIIWQWRIWGVVDFPILLPWLSVDMYSWAFVSYDCS